MPLWQVRVLQREQRGRERGRVREQFQLKVTQNALTKTQTVATYWETISNCMCVMGKSSDPNPPPPFSSSLPLLPNCDALYNFV